MDCCYAYGGVSDPPSVATIINKSSQYPAMKRSPDCRWGAVEDSLQYDSTTLPPSVPVQPEPDLATFDAKIILEVVEIIRASHQSINDIGNRYFKGLSLWVPFLCPVQFKKALVKFELAATAEFSLLLLCMSLNTYDPPHHCPPPIEHDALYLHAKTFFAQLQVLRPPCLATIQAGIFISTYEYAHGRPDDALTTIDTSARMAYRAGIHQKPERPARSEAWNTWWALRIFERTFYCETTLTDLPFITSTPDESEPLPHQNGDDESEERPSWTTKITPVNLVDVDCLGRAAQAARLLDRVFETMKSVAATNQIPTLIFLDGELQRLLSVTMNMCHGERGGHCGAVGISIRFVLREGEMDYADCFQSAFHSTSAHRSSQHKVGRIRLAHAFASSAGYRSADGHRHCSESSHHTRPRRRHHLACL